MCAAKKRSSRPKRQADERYNQRRRLKYAANKLKEQAELQSGNAKEETLKHIQSLEQSIRESYFDRDTRIYKHTIQQLERKARTDKDFLRKQSDVIREYSAQQNYRITLMKERYFKQAALTEAQREQTEHGERAFRTPEQKLIRAEQSFFYSATKVFWEGTDPTFINETIINSLSGEYLANGRRVQNLEDAVQFIKERYGNEFPTIEQVLAGKYDTDLDPFFSGESEDSHGSPNPITRSDLRSIGIAL